MYMADELNPNLGMPPTPPPIPPRPQMPPTPPPPPVQPRPESFTVRTMASDLQAPKPSEVMPPEKGPTPPPLSPETNMMVSMEEEPPRPKSWVYIIGGIIILIALVAVGYFVVYPLLTSEESTTPPTDDTLPVSQPSHQSYFTSAPAVMAEIRLGRIDLSEITFALQIESMKPVADESIKELAMLDANGDQIPFHDYFGTLAPVVDHMALAQLLENDFTAFLYYDVNGIWPGYVAKIKSGADLVQLNSELSQLSPADLATLFITPSGTLSSFKDGAVNGFPARYTSGSAPGAAFSYTILYNRFVLFSTSYAGAQVAAELLGFPR